MGKKTTLTIIDNIPRLSGNEVNPHIALPTWHRATCSPHPSSPSLSTPAAQEQQGVGVDPTYCNGTKGATGGPTRAATNPE